jgi:prepilin-type N-terminal cleavage/methylation domain-containing protein
MRAMKYAAQTENGRRRSAVQAGFTLLELLIVMALTAILIVLVFRPLIDSFNLTSRAGTQVESQTAAREIMRIVSDELGNAGFIYDNTRPNTQINIWLSDSAGNPIVMPLQFGLVDFVAPSHAEEQTANPTGPVDPTTGEPILNPTAPAGQQAVSLPLAPGRLIERFFIALRDNRSGKSGVTDPTTNKLATGQPMDTGGNYHGYANRWADPHQQGSPGNDNRYTLFRATFLAYIQDPDNPKSYIPNLKLFHTGKNPNDPSTPTDAKTDLPIINDPNFFYDDGLAGDSGSKGNKKWAVPGWQDLAGDGKVYYWENWRAVATSVLQLTKADTISLDRDDKGAIIYDANNRPTPRALITFAPTYIENEPAAPGSLTATGAEAPYTAAAAYYGQHGAWTTPFRVIVYQNNTSGTTQPLQANNVGDPTSQNPLTYYLYVIDPVTNQSRIEYHQYNTGTKTDTVVNSDVGPDINPTTGYFTNVNNSNPWMAFTVDPQRGIINFAFPQWVYTHKDVNGQPIRQQYNPQDIDAGIDLGAPYGRRFLSLDDQANNAPPDQMPAGSTSPLAALYLNPVTNDPLPTPQRVHIVPGSEVVYGPDQRPGPHYGWSIQYTRVASMAGTVGPNQYRINYDPLPNSTSVQDKNDPRARTGYIEFDSNPDTGDNPNLPYSALNSNGVPYEDPDNGQYRPHSLPLAKAGTSGSGGTVAGGYQPADPVLVEYSFQMNRPTDVVKIDYLTRELMTVSINSRLYDPSSASPQDTILTSQVKARNLQR